MGGLGVSVAGFVGAGIEISKARGLRSEFVCIFCRLIKVDFDFFVFYLGIRDCGMLRCRDGIWVGSGGEGSGGFVRSGLVEVLGGENKKRFSGS